MTLADFKIKTVCTFSLLGLLGTTAGAEAGDVEVRVKRGLILRQLNGQVTLWQQGNSRQSQNGDRLQSAGEGVSTGSRSSVVLVIDLGIGQVNVSERTRVNVQAIRTTNSGGNVLRLSVPTGRVQLKVRRFTNPDSQLEIETPAGVAGVRGTQFGISIQNSGKMSIATGEGAVATTAQGRSVQVNGGFQNFTIPGEPPSEPVPLRDDPSLISATFVPRLEDGRRRLRLEGRVDTVNAVFIDNVEVSTDREGRFSVEVNPVSFPRLQVTVVTPLGKQQSYVLAFR
jgi:hypothetical protein